MLVKIYRSEVDNLLELSIRDKKKTIVTGLDGSGKSSILAKYFAKTKILKTNAKTTELYFKSKEVRELVDNYLFYDRHPIIDGLVYYYASLLENKDIIDLSPLIAEFNQKLDYYKDYNQIITFMHDKYINFTSQNKWIKILRPYIIKCYSVVNCLFSDIGVDVYEVVD